MSLSDANGFEIFIRKNPAVISAREIAADEARALATKPRNPRVAEPGGWNVAPFAVLGHVSARPLQYPAIVMIGSQVLG